MAARPLTWPICGRGLAAWSESLARAVAPDAATRPSYVVLRSDLPP